MTTIQGATMQAYLNKQEIKDEYLNRVRQHREADQLVQGYGYWTDGKGCAVGCTIHSGRHADYETLLGIPRILARLEDCIFEGLPVADARKWPERFMSSIAVGADLSRVWYLFAAWLLSSEAGLLTVTDRNRAEIDRVSALYRRANDGDMPTREEWRDAADAATYAADAADAADAAADAVAAYAATYAAYAAYAATYAAYAADAVAAAARHGAWKKMADKLIELLAGAA